MTGSPALNAIRKRHFMLDALPDTIVIPPLGALRREQTVTPLQDATVDDIAFAMRGVEAEFNAIGDRLHALRKLYGLAREAGALGAERAVDAVARDAGGR
jgi:hypothetical protein